MEHASEAEIIATQGLGDYQRDVQKSEKSRRLIKALTVVSLQHVKLDLQEQ
jgi:hypothetical protein